VQVEHAKLASGKSQRFFMYQRQKFEIDESGRCVKELEMPDSEPLQHYQKHRGYESAEAIAASQQRYGLNSLHIELPSFKDAFCKQVSTSIYLRCWHKSTNTTCVTGTKVQILTQNALLPSSNRFSHPCPSSFMHVYRCIVTYSNIYSNVCV
jgi:hypothetical protein